MFKCLPLLQTDNSKAVGKLGACLSNVLPLFK